MKKNLKKCIIFMIVVSLVITLVPISSYAATNKNPGGLSAFFIGCCWGLREGLEYNEGASLHWREVLPVIPYVGLLFAVWNGLECAKGTTKKDWAEQNGANWY